jgi:hypothetical protein
MKIKVQREEMFDNYVMQLDGECVPGNIIHLVDDGREHKIVVQIPMPQIMLSSSERDLAHSLVV